MQNIDDLRNCIDEVDMQILELLDKRMDFVKKIGELKNSTGTAIYRPERERAIISRLGSAKTKNLSKNAIEAIFFEIFSVFFSSSEFEIEIVFIFDFPIVLNLL